MIKILKIFEENGLNVRAALIADTKDEVTDNAEIIGLHSNAVLTIGSTVLTTEGDYAIRNSSGAWVWQDEEETSQTASVTPSVQTLNLGRNILTNIEIEEPSEPDEPYEEPKELTER